LNRKEIDFPLGIGSWIIDIDIQMVWLPLGTEAGPPKRQTSLESSQGQVSEPISGGVLAGAVTVDAPASTVETVQAARD
jgi:phosphatidylinositol-3,4,5-trisphosphate 3-phosphatase/dual-specificity protein phosphatase PTEN